MCGGTEKGLTPAMNVSPLQNIGLCLHYGTESEKKQWITRKT